MFRLLCQINENADGHTKIFLLIFFESKMGLGIFCEFYLGGNNRIQLKTKKNAIVTHLAPNIKWAATWDFQQCGLCDQQSLRSACAYAQSDQSLCYPLEYYMNVKLLAEHHLDFLSLKGGCTGSSESTPVKRPHCWKSHVSAQIIKWLFCRKLFW